MFKFCFQIDAFFDSCSGLQNHNEQLQATPGGLFKMGWSNVAKNGGGMQMRIGIGSKAANPNQALFHMYVPKTFVPNSFANPSMGNVSVNHFY